MNEGFRLGSGGRLGGPFDRLAAAQRGAFALESSVGNDGENDPVDVRKAKRALARVGFFPAERARFPGGRAAMIADPDFQTGIRDFQRANDLKVDGFIRPGGETERAINRTMEGDGAPEGSRLKGVLSTASDDGPEPEDRLPKAAARGDGPTETAEKAESSVTGRPRLKPTPPPPPPLPTLRDPFAGRASEMRGQDVKGRGAFGVSRDGGTRRHEGLDIVGTPGEDVRAMATGTISKINIAYSEEINDGEPTYRTVEITTPSGYIVRQLYVEPKSGLKVGDKVVAGNTELGTLQDISIRFPGMTNHVHAEVRDPRIVDKPDEDPFKTSRFKAIDPTPLFESGQRIPHP